MRAAGRFGVAVDAAGCVFERETGSAGRPPGTSAIAIRLLALVTALVLVLVAFVALLRSASALLRTTAALLRTTATLLGAAALLALLATLAALVRAALALIPLTLIPLTLILISHRLLLLAALHGRGSKSKRCACESTRHLNTLLRDIPPATSGQPKTRRGA